MADLVDIRHNADLVACAAAGQDAAEQLDEQAQAVALVAAVRLAFTADGENAAEGLRSADAQEIVRGLSRQLLDLPIEAGAAETEVFS